METLIYTPFIDSIFNSCVSWTYSWVWWWAVCHGANLSQNSMHIVHTWESSISG